MPKLEGAGLQPWKTTFKLFCYELQKSVYLKIP